MFCYSCCFVIGCVLLLFCYSCCFGTVVFFIVVVVATTAVNFNVDVVMYRSGVRLSVR